MCLTYRPPDWSVSPENRREAHSRPSDNASVAFLLNVENIAKLCCIWRKLADSPDELASEGLKFLKGVDRQVYCN